MVYFAKIGGITGELTFIFFYTEQIQSMLRDIQIGSNMLSSIIVVSRALVLFCFLGFAIIQSNFLHNKQKKYYLIFSTVVCSALIFNFIPCIYNTISVKMSQKQLWLIDTVWRIFIMIILLFIAFLLLYNIRFITINWLKRRLIFVYIAVVELMCFFVVMGIMTPLQVSKLDRIYFLLSRIFYYNSTESIKYWRIIVGGSIIFTIILVVFLLAYLKTERVLGRPNAFLEKKALVGTMGIRVFSHGIKNQILANQVLIEELFDFYQVGEKSHIQEVISELSQNNKRILERMSELNSFFKEKKYIYEPVEVNSLISHILSEFKKKNLSRQILFEEYQNCNLIILVDAALISQTIINILNNSIDAIKNRGDAGKIQIIVHQDHCHAIIEINDNGCGIPRKQLNKAFTPFYTSKNSKNNWGIGLAYTQKILRQHGGSIRIQSIENAGTSVYLILPLYKRRGAYNDKRLKNKNSNSRR